MKYVLTGDGSLASLSVHHDVVRVDFDDDAHMLAGRVDEAVTRFGEFDRP
jgi:hypothetical protein